MSTAFFDPTVVGPVSLEEFIAFVDDTLVATDNDSIKAAAPMLQRLCANRAWFVSYLNEELVNGFHSDKVFGNRYSSNSLLMGRSRNENEFVIRANIWLPANDSLRTSADKAFFAEDILHDHTFNLLTGGLAGSGYSTRIYEYDFATCRGVRGEEVEWQSVQEFRLAEGSVLFMERNRAIHKQFPPKQPSVSLNLLCQDIYSPIARQHEFEETGTRTLRVKSLHYSSPVRPEMTESLVNICGSFANDDTRQIMVDLYGRLIEAPDRNEPAIVILADWFSRLGVDYSDLRATSKPISRHLKAVLDTL